MQELKAWLKKCGEKNRAVGIVVDVLRKIRSYIRRLYGRISWQVAGMMANLLNAQRREDSKRIDFLVEHLSGRTLKIAKALMQRGYKLRVYFYNVRDVSNSRASMGKLCECVDCGSAWRLCRCLMSTDAFVVHHFMDWSDASMACWLIKLLQGKMPPLVVEHYDVLNGMYVDIDDELEKKEQFAFENADGVVFREFCGEYLESECGFKMKHQLVFVDYFSETVTSEESGETEDIEREISLVYAGGVVTERQYPGASYACWMEAAELCRKNHCHLHVYPSFYDEEIYADYMAMAKSNEYFHFHEPVPYGELLEALSRYDYGIMPIKADIFTNTIGYTTTTKTKYASTNKVFDYIAAGLPMILYSPVLLSETMEKAGLCFRWPLERWDFDRLRSEYPQMKANVIRHRDEFSMSRNINRLVDFYRSLT